MNPAPEPPADPDALHADLVRALADHDHLCATFETGSNPHLVPGRAADPDLRAALFHPHTGEAADIEPMGDALLSLTSRIAYLAEELNLAATAGRLPAAWQPTPPGAARLVPPTPPAAGRATLHGRCHLYPVGTVHTGHALRRAADAPPLDRTPLRDTDATLDALLREGKALRWARDAGLITVRPVRRVTHPDTGPDVVLELLEWSGQLDLPQWFDFAERYGMAIDHRGRPFRTPQPVPGEPKWRQVVGGGHEWRTGSVAPVFCVELDVELDTPETRWLGA